jgi:hypothetical protein
MDGWIYGWLVPRSNRIRQGNKNTRELQSGTPALPMGKKEKEPWMGGSRSGHGQSILGLLFGPCNVTSFFKKGDKKIKFGKGEPDGRN